MTRRADTSDYWTHPWVSGVDMMHARFVRHAFGRHSHESFTIGALESGVEDLLIGTSTHRVGPGLLVLLDPDTVHAGRAATEEGWTYRVLYPEAATVRAAAGGPVRFDSVVVADQDAVALVLAAHRASIDADRLTASTALYRALRFVVGRHGERGAVVPARSAGVTVARRARELLHDRLATPPTLDELAAAVGVGKFALLRAFRARFGMPPHTYLTMLRVREARALLDDGLPAAAVAVRVGFCDQSHLSRQFRRLVGVPPGQYQRKNVQARCQTRG